TCAPLYPNRHSGAERSDEPGIHNHHREYGFRACAFGASRNDELCCGARNYTSLVASFKTFCRLSPCIRAMSSWYLSSAPRVSPTTCGVSERASSSDSAVAQSMVSATPGDL